MVSNVPLFLSPTPLRLLRPLAPLSQHGAPRHQAPHRVTIAAAVRPSARDPASAAAPTAAASTASTRAPVVNTPSHSSATSTTTNSPPDLSSAVPYFAYFANMNPAILGPRAANPMRRITPLHTVPATLPSHRLAFDVPGLPPEPVFANLAADPNSTVQGVLHYLQPTDFTRLSISEGILPPESPFPAFLRPLRLGEVRDISVYLPGQTESTPAKSFFFLLPTRLPRPSLRPSRRYVGAAVLGAEFWRLPRAYVAKLRTLPVELGPLGGFGLVSPPRPHLLDRPDPEAAFGDPRSELYSPWQRIGAKGAVRSFERDDASKATDTNLRLVHISSVSTARKKGLRKMYFVPGLDGTGKSVLSQMDALDEDGEYDVCSMVYPFANRQSLEEIASSMIDLLLQDAQGQPISLVGESMGAVLLILAAQENIRRKNEGEAALDIDLLMMINPATCYKRSNPKVLWEFLLSMRLNESLYASLLPPVLLPFVIDIDSARHNLGPRLVPRLRKVLGALADVSDVLPQDALSHRLGLLSEFSAPEADLARLADEGGPKNIAVVSCINDNLIPSLSENYRLQRCIPNIYSMILPYGGHVPMFDSRFSLASFLKPFKMENRGTREDKGSSQDVSLHILKRRDGIRKRLAKGNPSKDQLASSSYTDVQRLKEWLGEWTTRSSPVFVGEENLPTPVDGKPVLLVCNHTLLGWLDGMYPSQRILETKGVLVRPLSHPSLFRSAEIAFPGVPKVSVDEMTQFGLVTVSPSSLLDQLANGRWAMLFPGGAREALKNREDKSYSVIWPESPEFIRSCALFGATIIPVSTVGQEDMVNVIVDSKSMASAIDRGGKFFGRPDILTDFFEDNAKPWKGASGEEKQFMVPPLIVPTGADRLYFRFGKPVEVSLECLSDPSASEKLYRKVRTEVEDGITILLRRREFDTFRSLEERTKFSETHGDDVQPPASPAWAWTKGSDAYLDEDLQPPM